MRGVLGQLQALQATAIIAQNEILNNKKKTTEEKLASIAKTKKSVEKNTAESKNQAAKQTEIFVTTGYFSIAAMLFFSILIAKSITGPIAKVNSTLNDIAEGEGDLTQKLDDDRRDELGELARNFNTFTEKLKNIISSIGVNANQLLDSSENFKFLASELTNSSTTLVDKSQSSQNMVQQVVGNAEDMSGIVNEVRENTEVVNTKTDEISSSVNGIASAMEEAQINLNQLAEATQQMAECSNEIAGNAAKTKMTTENAVSDARDVQEKIAKLDKVAESISEIVETITQISEQTKTLALNATIEAARAGEMGKGFAVVANEVKQLAQFS